MHYMPRPRKRIRLAPVPHGGGAGALLPQYRVHRDARLGIAGGDRIVIGNRRASVRLHTKVFDGLQPGVIVVESVWPNSDFEGGVGINALVSAEPGRPNGGAVFHDTAVWVRKA